MNGRMAKVMRLICAREWGERYPIRMYRMAKQFWKEQGRNRKSAQAAVKMAYAVEEGMQGR